MPNNYILLEKIVVGSAGASSVTFANIPQTGYTDLVVKASARTTYASTVEGSTITFNGSNTYSGRYLQGDGSSASSGSQSILNALLFNAATATASTFGNSEMYIPNYTSTNQKSVSGDGVSENNATQAFAGLFASLATLTTGITTITIAGNAGGSFVANSTFYLYGVAKLGTTPTIAPKATGGDVVMTDGTYWYHAFRSSGTFTPALALTCDVLAVAGGGGGGQLGGGGGAGGLLAFTSQGLTTTAYTVTIGAGGSGAAANASVGTGALATQGTSTTFTGLTTAVGGGAGGSWDNRAGSTGGSGGGGAGGSTMAGYAGTSGQGNIGGTSGSTTIFAAGGGGGAGGAASNVGTASAATNGGAGNNTYSTWATATSTGVSGFYAGGGGGGNWSVQGAAGTGTNGGGNGSNTNSSAGGAGTANTGSGGGGGGWTQYVAASAGGAGGSGIVIVRYLVA